jgi:hypothetical protein
MGTLGDFSEQILKFGEENLLLFSGVETRFLDLQDFGEKS